MIFYNLLLARNCAVDVANNLCIIEEDGKGIVDWDSDECCLCKMNGNLIYSDGYPAAFHSRCVGVVSNLLPEGDWYEIRQFEEHNYWTLIFMD